MRRVCIKCGVTKPEEYFPVDVNKIEEVCSKCLEVKEKAKKRKCLKCDSMFKSRNAGHRICGACKLTIDYKNSEERRTF